MCMYIFTYTKHQADVLYHVCTYYALIMTCNAMTFSCVSVRTSVHMHAVGVLTLSSALHSGRHVDSVPEQAIARHG